MKNIVAIIQARAGSSRLPGKVLLPLAGKELLLRVVDRVLQSKHINHIVVATTRKKEDQQIADLLWSYSPKVSVFRGSKEDVLDRYYQAAKEARAGVVVRIGADNPLIDPEVIDRIIEEFEAEPGLDFASNNIGPHTYPRGLDAEVISFTALEKLWQTTTEPIDREHVTIHIKRFPDSFKWKLVKLNKDLSSFRWTVDEEADYKLAKTLYDRLLPEKPHFRMQDILELYEKDPSLKYINANVKDKLPMY